MVLVGSRLPDALTRPGAGQSSPFLSFGGRDTCESSAPLTGTPIAGEAAERLRVAFFVIGVLEVLVQHTQQRVSQEDRRQNKLRTIGVG